ncbi:Putative ATPase, nucleotide binding domain-containing protein [Colletotrichum destructivum]|uniref:ATPase, nucleotide binding domain-containing protein n=1 Tax=Colletotrichum destructivum TaxID=34406 RepID=A0AAX4I249_9PEZI|nr:Putative ATPase, nucleotide binding domain-containing protein [Colletotrichum destructivum]
MSGFADGYLSVSPDEHAIIIGIDFGTTFSGVSWAFSGQPNDIEVITRWEAELNYNSDTEKTPSTLLYHGPYGEPSWGYGIPAATSAEPLKWFKLLLIDHQDLPREPQSSAQIATARRLMSEANMEPVDVIAGYLRRLWNHSIECITLSTGKELVKMCRFHVIITLPAIWPAYAKARMRRAAQEAGILENRSAGETAGETVLSFISEPEAAALATMRDLSNRPNIKPGDHFVVCDAGGGTVDLISYEITDTKPMVVREAVKGNGGLCGGVFLDEGFVNLMKSKIGLESWASMSIEDIKKLMNGDWEHGIKQQFDARPRDWPVTLPAGCFKPGPSRRMMKKETITLNHSDLLPVFETISQQIIKLIQEQIDGIRATSGKLPKYVILVGGFGRCRYLSRRIQLALSGAVELLQSQGTRPWTAICRGAVIQGLTRNNLALGLSVRVKSRIARMNYGTTFDPKFDPKLHHFKDKLWDEIEQDWKAKDQMEWYMKKGDDITDKRTVRHRFYERYLTAPSEIIQELFHSAATPAPKRADSTTKRLCTITWNRKVNFDTLPTFTNILGKVYHELIFDIEMISDGASLDFTIFHGGKRVGGKNVIVEFEPEGGEAFGRAFNAWL